MSSEQRRPGRSNKGGGRKTEPRDSRSQGGRPEGPRTGPPARTGPKPKGTSHRPASDGPPRTRRHEPPFTIKGDLLFGRNAILEVLRSTRRSATRLWVADGMRKDPRVDEIVEHARGLDVLVEIVPRSMLDDQLPDVNHQGVLLEAETYPYADLADVVEAEGTVLILDHLLDPQNVGTLLRAAEAAGVAGVILPSDRSASITPAVVNASAGAVEHLAIAGVPNLGNAIDKLEASGRWILGLDGGPDSRDLFATDIPTPAALVVGSEGSGLSQGIRKKCQLIVSIPMAGQVDSLNAATAGSIALYDLVRRQNES
jgi:23S rRNA (guanosine2251-2'-O)-methyltransferase